MAGSRNISIITTHQDVDLTSGGSKTSEAFDLTTKAQEGIFSLQVEIEGGSTSTSVTITYLLSNEGINFITPTGAVAIVTAVDVSGGLDQIYSFEPELAKWIQIKVQENSTGTVVDCTCNLAVQ